MFGLAAGELRPLALPDVQLRAANPEKYWLQMREQQFLLPKWRNFLNNGSLGVMPRPVLTAVEDFMEKGAGLLSDEYPRWGYETLDEERAELAAFLGCRTGELAIMHSATEALSTVAAGLDLQAGDEVLMTDREHPSGKAGWQMRAARHGITLREVKIPHPPKSSGELAEIMIGAIGPRTRVISFSGILSPTGVIMPVRQICAAARAKGVLSLVDGAHMSGQIDMNLSELGADFLAGSPHKWMFAPAGSGYLYIREEHLDRLWPSTVTGDWDTKSLQAARFMRYGTNNRAVVVGMIAGLRFLQAVGAQAVYARIHSLGQRIFDQAMRRPYLRQIAPSDPRLRAGLVTIGIPPEHFGEVLHKAKQRHIWTLLSSDLRISGHIHTRPEDIDAFFTLLDEVCLKKRG
jgi:selenocysteine lyase/cysteine desulfurase